MADVGSKLAISTDEWSIDRRTYSKAVRILGLKPTIDAMATTRNSMCERFFSGVPQYRSMGINFFAQTLSAKEVYWICPPPKSVAKVFKHLLAHEDDITAYIGFPEWKHSSFWTMIINGGTFHKCVQKVFYIYPTYRPNNKSDTMFNGTKSFRLIIILIKTKTTKVPRLKHE